VVVLACSTSEQITRDASVDVAVEKIQTADVVDAASDPDAQMPEESGIVVNGPAVLSQSGLYSDIGTRTIAPDVIEYTPRWSLWSDGAEKRRWIQVPKGQQIDTSNIEQWSFPIGTKLWKEFKVGTTIVETRFLWKQGNDWTQWWMGAYRWRVDGSDADYEKLGEANALGTDHDVPSQLDCTRCHAKTVVDVGIGFSALQLSAPQNSQLAKFAAMGWFTNAPAKEWDAPGQGIEHDALAYMHANCGHCHNENGWLYMKQTQLVLRLRTTDVTPQQTGAYAAINLMVKHNQDPMYGMYAIVGGAPSKSQAWLRMNVRGYWAMPPVCTKKIDTAAVQTVGTWISSLPVTDQ